MNRRRTTPVVLTALAALAVAGLTAPPATGDPGRQDVPRTAPTWVKGAASTGRAPAAGTSTFTVFLQPHGGTAALDADVARVSDPASPSYGEFLSAEEYAARYDATPAAAATVAGYLRDQGLTVTSTDAHRRFLTVSGTNARVERALGTSLRRFRHDGQDVQANTDPVSLPPDVAGLVSTVTGLDTTERMMRHRATTYPAGSRTGTPCSAYYGEKRPAARPDGTQLPAFEGAQLPLTVCGYTGPTLRTAYAGADQRLTGKGVTVAITDAYASPSIAEDAAEYVRRHGGATYGKGQLQQVVPKTFRRNGACGETGWWGEETLDVEAVHAVAPAASILYYGAASCFDDDFLSTLQRVVDDNRASLVSNSWGDLEENTDVTTAAAYQAIFRQGAMQGIGFVFSSGDAGDEEAASGTRQVDYPTSDPYATSVGGTVDAIGQDGSFLFQTGWGSERSTLTADGTGWTPSTFLSGAGGGTSTRFGRPDWQTGVTSGDMRVVPDTAMTADPMTGMLVGQTQKFPEGVHYDEYRIGGTSLAAPLFAGMSALRAEKQRGRLGFLNPAIYANRAAFTDVAGTPPDAGNVRADYANGLDATAGLAWSVRTFDRDASLHTGAGWDPVTGVGRPNTGWFSVGR